MCDHDRENIPAVLQFHLPAAKTTEKDFVEEASGVFFLFFIYFLNQNTNSRQNKRIGIIDRSFVCFILFPAVNTASTVLCFEFFFIFMFTFLYLQIKLGRV
jgi:hypothetical protein